MNETLARQIFAVIVCDGSRHGVHVALDIVEACAMRWPNYPWLDWASDWEHEQLAKRYAA